jgi:hypothetical protein
MAVMTDTMPVDRLREQAAEVKFGRTLATLIAGFFWLLGWAAGHAWTSLVFCALAMRLGFREGAGRTVPAGPETPPGPVRPGKLQ